MIETPSTGESRLELADKLLTPFFLDPGDVHSSNMTEMETEIAAEVMVDRAVVQLRHLAAHSWLYPQLDLLARQLATPKETRSRGVRVIFGTTAAMPADVSFSFAHNIKPRGVLHEHLTDFELNAQLKINADCLVDDNLVLRRLANTVAMASAAHWLGRMNLLTFDGQLEYLEVKNAMATIGPVSRLAGAFAMHCYFQTASDLPGYEQLDLESLHLLSTWPDPRSFEDGYNLLSSTLTS
jgi:hypothetical protein